MERHNCTCLHRNKNKSKRTNKNKANKCKTNIITNRRTQTDRPTEREGERERDIHRCTHAHTHTHTRMHAYIYTHSCEGSKCFRQMGLSWYKPSCKDCRCKRAYALAHPTETPTVCKYRLRQTYCTHAREREKENRLCSPHPLYLQYI